MSGDDSTLFQLYKNEYPNATFKNTLLGELHLFALEQGLFGAFSIAGFSKLSFNEKASTNNQEATAMRAHNLFEENWGKEIADEYKARREKVLEDLDKIDITEGEQEAAIDEFDRIKYNFKLSPQVKAKYNFRRDERNQLVSDLSEAFKREREAEQEALANRPALEKITEEITRLRKKEGELAKLEKKKKKTRSEDMRIGTLRTQIRLTKKVIEDLSKQVERERRAAVSKVADETLAKARADAAKKR